MTGLGNTPKFLTWISAFSALSLEELLKHSNKNTEHLGFPSATQ